MDNSSKQYITEIRKFNRFYTNIIGLVNQNLLESPYSLAEGRVLLEIEKFGQCTPRDLVAIIQIDPGYLSRILKRFKKEELIKTEKSEADKRSQIISITEKGRHIYHQLSENSNAQIVGLLNKLPQGGQQILVNNMQAIQNLLSGNACTAITIREAKPGEPGYIAYRHGVLYTQEYELDPVFDKYVMESLTDYLCNTSAGKIFIAEYCGVIAGFIGVVEKSPTTGQLRWFLVEPEFRGVGLGRKLVSTAMEYCKAKGYKNMYLWTFKGLNAARHLYEEFNFVLTEEVVNNSWKHELIEQRFDYRSGKHDLESKS